MANPNGFCQLPSVESIHTPGKRQTGKGKHLEVYLQPEGAKGMTFRPRVLISEPGRELRWLGHLVIPGLFDGEHIFIIEPLVAGGVQFIQREIITGLLVPLFARRLDTETRRGFEDMNQALKLEKLK